jgi:DHA1 family solute carrier family 18 vesicular amine transporter 1/2
VEPYRRITLGVGLAMFVDATLYLAVLPLLPHYADRFHLSTPGVAVVLAAYPAASPLIALACIPLAPRIGGRRIALASGVVMTFATIVFAFAPNVETLIAARFLQGIASGTVWTASMAWVTHNAPLDRRGRESGIVMGLLSAGSIAGPLVGAFASFAGEAPAFLTVAVLSAVSVLVTALAPAGTPMRAEGPVRASLAAGFRQPFVRAALAMSVLDTVAFATVDLLVPLDLGHHGASTAAIAAALTGGAVIGALVGPPGGRLVDRVGAGRVGLAMGIVIGAFPLVLAFGLPRYGLLAILVAGGPVFAVAASAMYPLASAGADRAGVAHVAVNGILGSAWATGFATAPLVASAVAALTSQAVAFATAATLTVPLLVVIARNGLGARADPST